jgi:hypothetical protein
MSDDTGEDILGALIGIGSGILLGMLGAAILDSLSKPRCPHCKYRVEKNATYCENCKSYLRWD